VSESPIYDALRLEFAGRYAREAVREGLTRRTRYASPTRLAILSESALLYAVSAG
jgi:hypothetical protein